MPSDILALELLVADIAAYAKHQIDNGTLCGPRFAAYVKLAWFGQSGSPCYSDCKNLLDALQILRDLDNDSEVDTFYIAMTAALMECYPEPDQVLSDFDAIRRMSAELRHVA
ncbi:MULTISPECIES: hypothetical protein [Cohaesibacter]|uniref:hypothetical protein n=1 Tax=Cohaesibacter TaxID=655352 RepID=UPI000DEB30D5|nr:MULTISPECIES: hypothetical protein [Cohaesibacter]TLP45527.1 hypothetical protein FDK21_12300 [Cohaesibacter sp. CAU 1516]